MQKRLSHKINSNGLTQSEGTNKEGTKYRGYKIW